MGFLRALSASVVLTFVLVIDPLKNGAGGV